MRRFLERCYEKPSTIDAWLAGLVEVCGAAIAPREGIMFTVGTPPRDMRAEWAWGRGERILPKTKHHEAPVEFLEVAYRPFLVTKLSRQFGRTEMSGHPEFDRYAADCALNDAVGLMARDGATTVVVTIPLMPKEERSDREPLFYRARRHLHGGLSGLRRASDDDVVASPDGRLLHEGNRPRPNGMRPLLRDAARAYDRERRGHAPDRDAERVWRELWEGGWTVTETVDADGKRMLLLRRDDSSPKERAIQSREATVLQRVAHGASYKSIAMDLGLSISTVSTIATRAYAKLGFQGRVDFVQYAAQCFSLCH